MPQIDQCVRWQFHTVVPLLFELNWLQVFEGRRIWL